jgi:membrane protein implicated in regulation of membrane protease activity
MMDILIKAKRILWECVELGFIALLAVMLIYLILGQSSGVFVLSVAANVIKFTNDVPAASLIAFAILAALFYLVARRLRARET